MLLTQDSFYTLKQLEGFSATPYWDHKQWSIGYGSFAGSFDKSKKPSKKVTEPQAAALLIKNVESFEQQMLKVIEISLQPNQWDALVLFCYNLGAGILTAKSKTYSTTLAEDINAGNFAQLTKRMLLYVNASGAKVEALVKRRNIEVSLFTQGLQFVKDNAGALGLGSMVLLAIGFFF